VFTFGLILNSVSVEESRGRFATRGGREAARRRTPSGWGLLLAPAFDRLEDATRLPFGRGGDEELGGTHRVGAVAALSSELDGDPLRFKSPLCDLGLYPGHRGEHRHVLIFHAQIMSRCPAGLAALSESGALSESATSPDRTASSV
jgi:hypothetical protein